MSSYITAEISRSRLEANIAFVRSRVASNARLCGVVKADCYGHGWDPCLDVILPRVDWLAVATPLEALELRRRRVGVPILVFFSPTARGEAGEGVLDSLIAQGVTLTMTAAHEQPLVEAAAERAQREAVVHVKIDTGMSRSGIRPEAAVDLVRSIRSSRRISLAGIYTHFATADYPESPAVNAQFATFNRVIRAVGGRDELLLHAANSAAVLNFPETHLDMVRVGLLIYGYNPSGDVNTAAGLGVRGTLSLTGVLMQTKDLPSGAQVGYGLTHTLARPGRIGLVPIGYGDGYWRAFSGRACMKIRGCYAKVLGRVSMDQTVVDLTNIPEARVGDEVEIISADREAPQSVENLARMAETISYEITCLIGNRATRHLAP